MSPSFSTFDLKTWSRPTIRNLEISFTFGGLDQMSETSSGIFNVES